jgi:hypothetical protein
MILVRDVFHAKYGRGDELVALFKEAFAQMPDAMQTGSSRLMTDLSGPYFTIVTEYEVESLAAWERQFAAMMAQPDPGGFAARMNALVESGRREFYTLVA